MNTSIYNFPLFECQEFIGVHFLLNIMLQLLKMLTPLKTLFIYLSTYHHVQKQHGLLMPSKTPSLDSLELSPLYLMH